MAGTRERRIAAVLGEEIRVAMARQRVNGLQLSKLTGISNSTLSTLLNGSAAMDVDQLARICQALGLEPGPFYSDAIAKADGTTAGTNTSSTTPGLPPMSSDPRTLLQQLLDNPDRDDVLRARLADAAGQVGEKSYRAKQLAERIRHTRHEELSDALDKLPPSENRAANQ